MNRKFTKLDADRRVLQAGIMCFISLSEQRKCTLLLHAVFVGLDHFLNHLTADGTCLLGGEIAVVALLEVDTNLGGCTYSMLNNKNSNEKDIPPL